MISTSPIRISCVVAGDQVPDAVRALHAAFELSGAGHDPARAAVRGVRMSGLQAVRVAVVGATGAVGTVMLRLLRERELPGVARSSRSPPSAPPAASSTAASSSQPLDDETIEGFDVALFSAGATRSREWAPRFVDAGAVVVDNSSAFRMDDDVPLVVSEVNPERARRPHAGSSPTRTARRWSHAAAQGAARRLRPARDRRDELPGRRRRRAEGHRRARRAGRAARRGRRAARATTARPPPRKVAHAVHAATLAFNVVPLLGTLGEDGYTDEELKLRNESRKILAIPDLAVSPTCVRVPVMVGHGVAGARDVRARGRPRAGARACCARSRASSSTTSRRRSSTPAATRSPSAASAATSPTRTR